MGPQQQHSNYMNTQHQGRFEYADPWLAKSKQHYYENNQFDKSSFVRKTNRLLRQQHETEKQLEDMRQLLKVELDELDETCVRDERTQERIDQLEQQIKDLHDKLESINHEISVSRLTSQQQSMISMESRGEEFPRSPLFIIGDPQRGTAAAIAQGSIQEAYEEEEEE